MTTFLRDIRELDMAVATKLHVLDCGAMSCDLTWLLLKPGRSIRSRADRDRPVEWYPCTTHAVLVETPEGTMLWDTSCPRDWETRWVPTGLHEFFPYDQVSEEEYLDSRLRQLGVDAAQLDYVVLSHLHFDHAGNVAAFGGAGPRLVVNDKEKEWAFGYSGAFNGAHLKSDYEGLDFETVSGDTEFLPGVTLIEAPGHTPGTMAMKVDLPETGTMIFTLTLCTWGIPTGRRPRRRRSSTTCPPGMPPLRNSAASPSGPTPR